MNPNNPTGQCFSQTGVSLAPNQLPLPGSEWRTPPLFYVCSHFTLLINKKIVSTSWLQAKDENKGCKYFALITLLWHYAEHIIGCKQYQREREEGGRMLCCCMLKFMSP